MASEIRVNKIENRSGLGTVTFADTGVDLAGIVTATTFSGSGASLTDLPAGNLTGALPAISGANLTGISAGTSLSGSTNNTVCTVTGANAIQGESNVQIDSSGRLLIGTTTEGNENGDELTISKDSGAMGMTLRSGDSSNCHLYFSDATSGTGEYAGYIAYQHSDNSLQMGTDSTERLRIDSTGNLKFNSGYGSVTTAFGVRAWVSFNGQGTPAIRGDGGVSSVGDNDSGDFTVNFDSNMPDVNYAVGGLSENWEGTNNDSYTQMSGYTGGAVVGSYRFVTLRSRFDQQPPQKQDPPFVQLIFVR